MYEQKFKQPNTEEQALKALIKNNSIVKEDKGRGKDKGKGRGSNDHSNQQKHYQL